MAADIPPEFAHLRDSESIPWDKLVVDANKLIKKGMQEFEAFTDIVIDVAKKEQKKKNPNLDIMTIGIEACIARGRFDEGVAFTNGLRAFRILTLRAIALFTISDASKIKDIQEQVELLAGDNPSLLDQVRLLSVRILYGASAQDESVLAHIIEFDNLLEKHTELMQNPIPETLFTIYVIGVLFSQVGENERALKTAFALERIGHVTNRQTVLILSENLRGRICNRLGEFQEAEIHYRHVLQISKSLGHRLGLGIALNNLGSLMLNSLRLEEAFEYLQQANELLESDAHRIVFLTNLGEITALLGELERSKEYMQQALALDQRTSIGIIEPYTWMVILLTRTREFQSASHYLASAKKIADRSKTPKDKAAYYHAKGVLEGSEETTVKAIKSLTNALKIAKENRLLEWLIRPLLDIVRTYLSAFKSKEEEEYLDKAAYHLEDLIQIAREQKLHSLNAEALLLRSEIRAHAGRIDEAKEDLDRVAGLASFLDNSRLESIVAERIKALSKQSVATVPLGYSEIDKAMDRVAGFHPARDHEEVPTPQIHVLIAMNRASGLPEYVHHFDDSLEMDSSILSGFITAITQFAGEMMGSGLIRSINQEGFTLMMEHTSNRIVTLIVSKETFDVRFKLNDFANQFEETFPASKDSIVTSEYQAAGELVSAIFGS
ncbi:MAG: tetratricopeptide repeat protein [Candidatus Thorarchaeota archaeon]